MSMKRTGPPDRPARDRIVNDLGTTFLVEAGAGSGKTRSLVDRMIAVIASGRATIDTLTAVTFTRKAAAELRERFQVGLERARIAEGDLSRRARFDAALEGLERSFIGTIHSFCARLLRERPIEAGIDPEFRELEEHEDRILLEKAWDEYQAKARLENDAAWAGLEEAGLEPADLEAAFKAIALFPEVEAVPGRDTFPELEEARRELEAFLDRTRPFIPAERSEKGRDPLQSLIIRCLLRRRTIGFSGPRRLMETLELFDKNLAVTKNRWRSKEEADGMLAAAESFRDGTARPALRAWREFRHTKALAYVVPAVGFYDEMRRAEGRLNFQDQLMRAARLLRDNPEVRRYFRKRFHPILVDEFQDTDPIQAEILFFLAGADDAEKDWARILPRPGSLFLVGDPKQSIYRFRRADIDIYNLVKERIKESGGEILELSANFRSLRPIADWVDPLFDPGKGGLFPAEADAYQAGFMPLETSREAGRGAVSGIRRITVPAMRYHAKEAIAGFDSQRVAEFIAWSCAGHLRLTADDGGTRPAEPGDFLVLLRTKDRMSSYARRLEELGVPYEIAGSDAFSDNSEIGEILNLLHALDDPDDPVYTAAVLRGLFFGLSDQDLLEHRAAGGGFSYLAGDGGGSPKARRAFDALRRWRDLTMNVPPSAALEAVLQSSGLLNHLVTAEMGSSRAGNVFKLIEALRGREGEEMTSFAAAVEFIEEWAGAQPVEEMSLTPGRRNAVRLMNLHKAKGLEAPVVMLSNPSGLRDFEPDKHICRTAGRPLGHFRFTRPHGFASRTVSQPVDWEEKAGEERKYEDAEENRLMYVAATRARDLLVISTYEGNMGRRKSWGPLEEGLAGVEELPVCLLDEKTAAAVPGKSPARKRARLKPTEVREAREELRRKMGAASRAGEILETVTSLAGRDRESMEWLGGGLGMSWGSAVHSALKSLGPVWRAGGAVEAERLLLLARNALVAAGRGAAEAGKLAELVQAIVRSGFWLRAMRAEKSLFEVPFSVRVGPDDPDHEELASKAGLFAVAGGRPVASAPGAPVFLSGAIDLVFKEKDGWVVADYKTDRIPEAAPERGSAGEGMAFDALVGHYRPQVLLYTRFWEKITGEKVKEAGLYFTALDRWVPIGRT